MFVCSRSPCGPQYDYHTSLLVEMIRAIKLLFRYMPMTTISHTCSQHDFFFFVTSNFNTETFYAFNCAIILHKMQHTKISCNLKIVAFVNGILNKTHTNNTNRDSISWLCIHAIHLRFNFWSEAKFRFTSASLNHSCIQVSENTLAFICRDCAYWIRGLPVCLRLHFHI